MISRRFLLFSAVAGALIPVAAFAETVTYTPADFAAAQAAGRSILVDIRASWCPTCKAQAQALAILLDSEPQLKNLLIMEIDFDSQKDVVKRFGARSQATLITFKGGNEVGRSVGDTNIDSLADLLEKAI